MSVAAVHQRPLAPEADAVGVSYAEVLAWATWLELFTASDLADAMGVNVVLAERGIRAMRFHGACEDTGDEINGEAIIRYRTFQHPADPREHPSKPPEWQTCEMEILSPRGLPIRLINTKESRRERSMPGQGHRMRQREKRYREMMEKREQAYEASLAKAQKEPKWKRRK